MKANKKVIGAAGLAAILVVGGSFAYFNQTMTVNNPFDTGKYDTNVTEDFNPSCVLAESATLSATKMTGDVHFSRWFGEWEIRRTQTDFCFRAKQFTCKVEQRLLQVGKRHVFIDVKSLNLMEEAVGARRDSLVAVYASRTKHPDRWLGRFHYTALYAGCMCTQDDVVRYIHPAYKAV